MGGSLIPSLFQNLYFTTRKSRTDVRQAVVKIRLRDNFPKNLSAPQKKINDYGKTGDGCTSWYWNDFISKQ